MSGIHSFRPSLFDGICAACGMGPGHGNHLAYAAPVVSPTREDGRRLRDEGMALVDAHAHPVWKASFDRALERLASSGVEFTAEDVTAVAGMPAQPNAVGARFSAAKRRGVIREVGFRQADRASRHASRQLVWIGTKP